MQVRIHKPLIKPLKDFAKTESKLQMRRVSVTQAANKAIKDRLTPNPYYASLEKAKP